MTRLGSTGGGASESAARDLAADRLLEVAEAELDRHGLKRFTMDGVAEAAGVSRPTVYRYFGDRTKLIEAIFDRRAARLVSRVHRVLDAHDRFEDKLVEGILYLVEVGRSDELAEHLLTAEGSRYSGESGVSPELAEAMWRPTFTEAQRAGILPSDFNVDAACRWLNLVSLAMVRWPTAAGDVDPRVMLEAFLVPACVRQ